MTVESELSLDQKASRSTIAPWWHTALIVILIAATSVLGSLRPAKTSMSGHHLANYGVTLAWEWVLAALTYWGIRLKKTPLRELLGERRPGRKAFLLDVGAAAVFWIVSLMVLAVLAVLLRLLHLESAQKQISQLAPASVPEAILWIALSLSAGMCEEFLFRGYLQQQFARATGHIWVGVLVSAVLFGAAHGYEGIAGMLMITAYGALFSILAIRRKSLRAGMIAHAWHDSITGLVLWFLKHARVPLGLF
ncbi:type II CAAX endopeptidase family protein [Acidisarcina polymorpha]|nr:type II CAAX endopeptidase family protein [Acidisarcina polymorpha]